MRFTPSSSVSSSSSSSTATFESFPTTTTTTRGTVLGCISVVLSRVLCSIRSLPTHPSDQLNFTDEFEVSISKSMKDSECIDSSSAPTVVARLMGLESMPEVDSIGARKGVASVTRSKSMNSADWRGVEGETGETQSKHRRASSSFSFRVTPGFFEIEDDDFFVLEFENRDEKKISGRKKVKSDMGFREHGVRRSRRRTGKLSSVGRPSLRTESNSIVLTYHKENSDGIKGSSKKKKKEKCLGDVKLEIESGLENSSPVSVLDHREFIGDHEVSTSEEHARNRSSSSRRTLSSELSNTENFSTKHDNNQSPQEICREANAADASKTKPDGMQRKDYHKRQSIETLNKICKLAELEIRDSIVWNLNGRTRNLIDGEDDIGTELGLFIMNQLIAEEVDQLCRS